MAATIAKPMARPVLVLSSDVLLLALGKVAFAEEKKIICVRGEQPKVVYYDKDFIKIEKATVVKVPLLPPKRKRVGRSENPCYLFFYFFICWKYIQNVQGLRARNRQIIRMKTSGRL